MHEQAQAKNAGAGIDGLTERNEQRHGLSRAGDDDLLALVYTLEQLRERAASVVRVVLSK